MKHVGIVLAAGKSTRMRSRLPKTAHPICGRPMLAHVLSAASSALGTGDEPSHAAEEPPLADAEDHSTRLIVVLGHESQRVQEALRAVPDLPPYLAVHQEQQLGTGDAVRAARTLLTGPDYAGVSTVVVLYGDTPLVRPQTLSWLLETHEREHATLSFITGYADGPTGYGRVIRDSVGRVQSIVEEKHCTPEQLRIPEVNSGIYCFAADWLWSRLDRLGLHSSGEYYLTDLVEWAASEGRPITTVDAPLEETAGVNDRIQLAEASAVLRRRVLDALMLSGVTVVDPASTFVEAGVRVGQDTTIHPFTTLQGSTIIGEDCQIGPHSVVRDSEVGDGCAVIASWVEESTLEPGARVGPMSHLRPGAYLASGVHVGNFAEVKNARLSEGVQQHHFSYIGDASIGAHTNVGAGTITCNYDGERKHRTEVGKDVFLGSDTLLVAPVSVGDGAQTGAGAVVRQDVPPGALVVGVPARLLRLREPRGIRTDLTIDADPASPAADTAPTSSGTSGGAASGERPDGAQAPPSASAEAPESEFPSRRPPKRATGREGKEF